MNFFFFIIFFILKATQSFNVDLESRIVYQGNKNTMFGFSLVGHRENNRSWVIVGAPEDESRAQKKAGVKRPGAVYKCQTRRPFDCHQIPFDTTGNNNVSGQTIDDKSYQWFGASVHSSGEDGVVVACAPRYVYFSFNKQRREPVGTCFAATDSFSKFSEYSPCRTGAWGFHQQGYCLAGFSTAVSKDRLFIGAVGSYYAQGQAFSQNLRNRLDYSSSKEGPELQDDHYLGYSLAIGDFTGTNSVDIAVGMPRGANLTGKVVLFTGRRLFHLHNLTGSQVGAYFGYSLATLDANGDGLDDLAIGAPLQSSGASGEFSESYETGRVYIVYQNAAHKFRHWDVLNGKESGGRFGLALSSLGDIDLDGYDDLIVGSPYTDSGRGAVFIFLGSNIGLEKTPGQIIRGSELGINIPKGFGFSVSGSTDLDGNKYPDLIVGAPDSDQTFYFRTRSVVRVNSEMAFEGTGGKINTEHRNCTLKSGLPVACAYLRGCLEFSGEGVDDELNFSVSFKLDSKKTANVRMFFLNEENFRIQEKIISLKRKKPVCTRTQVYLLPEVADKLSPIEAKMSYKILTDTHDISSPYRGRSVLRPIVDPRDRLRKITDSLIIQKDCGTDNVCVPDLGITYSASTDKYLIGSEERLDLEVTVTNNGEAAYEAVFYLQVPSTVYYKRIRMLHTHISDEEDIKGRAPDVGAPKVLCSPPSEKTNFYLKCDLGNPMMAFSRVSFRIVLKPAFGKGTVSSLDLNMHVNSSNPESFTTMSENAKNLSIPVIVETELKIRGRSEPEPVQFNASAYNEFTDEDLKNAMDLSLRISDNAPDESFIGPEITHVYQVENKGPSDINRAEVYILWPSFRINEDEPLLYLTSQPQTEGRVQCEFVNDVNPYGIKINPHRNSILSDEPFREKRSLRNGGLNYENDIDYSKHTEDQSSLKEESDEFLDQLDCGPTKCTVIYCNIGPLQKRQFALFRVRSRLWTRTLSKISEYSGQYDFEISSRLVTRVTELPYGVDPKYLGYESLRVTTHVRTITGTDESAGIPAWILLLSIFAGLLFLGLLSLLLYKLGFFRRRRPFSEEDEEPPSLRVSEERQPLAFTAKTTSHHHPHLQPGDAIL